MDRATLVLPMRLLGYKATVPRVLLGLKLSGRIGKHTRNAPGGKHEPGESSRVCAVRELVEECGLVAHEDDLEHVAHIIFNAAGKPDFVVDVYRLFTFTGEACETESLTDLRWYPINQLPFEDMLESDSRWFAMAAKGERFSAEVDYMGSATGFSKMSFMPYVLEEVTSG